MLEQIMTPEIAILGGILACGMAVLTLLLAGRFAFVQGLASRLTTLDTQIEERKKTLQALGQKAVETELLQSKKDHLERRLDALQQELGPIDEKYHKAVSEYEDVKGKLRSSKEEWRQIAEKVETYKSRISQINTLEQEIKELTKTRKELDEKLQGLSQRMKELKQLNLSVAEKTADVKKLDKEIQKLRQDSEVEQKKLRKTKEEFRLAEQDLKHRKDELGRLENVKIDLDARLETLSDKLKSVGRIPAEAFASLEIPIFDASGPVKENAAEQKAVEAIGQLVDYCGFDIPRRLQDAFHTALKTSDISCLTVMAGVSGTGKSAFPKLYAEAMGMYFLPLAVEPRWDSPQDLFGFLNYMENRFEATTLGRALVQFNNSPHAPESSATMRDRLLLVLLDEMNLARIEYYFSDFLSKLETRRNANILHEKDYRMVSVEVFAGHTADENGEFSPPVHLYAGSNVLFVGTMNEDESTQSLSDKVIDRANVLYFGRPNKLHDKVQQIAENREWKPINASDWQSWIVDPSSATIPGHEQIDNLINSLNHTLALLGRPFGWRTYKAIKAYIANHPAVRFREDTGLSPLADQIAMRVMPKLRGLDLAEHGEVFSSLGQTLQQINDTDLQQAFARASQSTQGFFDWRGISWER